MEIIIRKATAEDYEALCELIDEVDALHRNHLPRLFREPDGPVREEDYYLGLIADEKVGLFVAVAGKRLAGFIHVVILDAPSYPIIVPRRFANVDNLGVKPELRHNGIGRMLMDAAQEWAIAKGATSIELSVYEFNAEALAFYRQLGYATLSRRMGKWLDS